MRIERCRLFLFAAVLVASFSPVAALAVDGNEVDSETVRVAAVNTPGYSGLLDSLIPGFEKQSGYKVSVHSGEYPYTEARAGKADIIISHYGREELETFVRSGYGMWPKTVFANQAALIGPKSDPAKIRGLRDPVEAFRRIATTKSPYVANNSDGTLYLTEILWEASGKPEKDPWFIKTEESRGRAIKLADEKEAYVIFGAFPFLRNQERHKFNLDALVVDAPLFQRIMVTVVIDPQKISSANAKGAQAFERYLLSPKVQAAIGSFRMPKSDLQLWWPVGRSNDPHKLMKRD
jgi:tungstate transport system substrate-binding protein